MKRLLAVFGTLVTLSTLGALSGSVLPVSALAAGLDDDNAIDVPRRLVSVSLGEEVTANDPRVAKAREQIAKVAKATAETDQAVAQGCMRNARYIFDFSRQPVSPLEVLEALAKFAPAGKPMSDTTQRYFNLRVRDKLGHAAAMAALAAGK
jgi:hypothetical protein